MCVERKEGEEVAERLGEGESEWTGHDRALGDVKLQGTENRLIRTDYATCIAQVSR